MSEPDLYLPVDEARAAASAMRAFLRHCERESGIAMAGYPALQQWAARDYESFWRLLLAWSPLLVSGDLAPVVTEPDCERARYFPRLRLNYARNLLRPMPPDQEAQPALTSVAEDGSRTVLTRRELRAAVERMARGLERIGVRPGDRVVAIARNNTAAAVACLAATAIGATWSSVSPEMGDAAVLGRFAPLQPTLLCAHTQYTAHGVTRTLADRVDRLLADVPTIRHVVALDAGALASGSWSGVQCHTLDGLQQLGALSMDEWSDFPFNHPLFILHSSGTTGAPKCLVHGAGGTLIEHYKEHVLHSAFGPGERLCFQTSAGWMMWNWQLSALACGTQIVLFDGSPTYPSQDALLRMLDRERVTVFGTSATYLHALQQLGVAPAECGEFAHLHTIQSTGSVLFDAQYDWIAQAFRRVRVESISGGTDIIGCFVLGNPLTPIYRGESQCVSLGLDVRVMTPQGLRAHGEGELVCVNPFPSRPVAIHGDAGGERLHQTYFGQNPGLWTHGDRIRLGERGTARILGRSDGTLNVRGVRIGPAEIYAVVQALPEVAQAMALEQPAPREPGGSRMVLLVVLRDGMSLDRALTLRIKKELSQRCSPNHVPAVVAQVQSLPMTDSGKFSETAARHILQGRPLPNRAAIRNPEALDAIAAHPDLQPPR